MSDVVLNEAVGLEDTSTESPKIYFHPATETFYTTEFLPYEQIPKPNIYIDDLRYTTLQDQLRRNLDTLAIKADPVTGEPTIVAKEDLLSMGERRGYKRQEIESAYNDAMNGTFTFKGSTFQLTSSFVSRVLSASVNNLEERVGLQNSLLKALATKQQVNAEDIAKLEEGNKDVITELIDINGNPVRYLPATMGELSVRLHTYFNDNNLRLQVLNRVIDAAATIEELARIHWAMSYDGLNDFSNIPVPTPSDSTGDTPVGRQPIPPVVQPTPGTGETSANTGGNTGGQPTVVQPAITQQALVEINKLLDEVER